jgi:NAD/NADP transhydrogenase beta subunit
VIETTYQLTIDELVRTGFRRKVLRTPFVASISGLVLTGVVLLLLGGANTTAGALCVALAVAGPIGVYAAVRRTVSQIPWLTSTTHLTAGESGLTLSAAALRSQLTWPLIKSWSQGADHLFLYIDQGNTAITIPKRAFSATQLTEFLGYVDRVAA